jgi:hypothetical protein
VLVAQRIIKVFNGQDYELHRFGEFNERNRRQHASRRCQGSGSPW